MPNGMVSLCNTALHKSTINQAVRKTSLMHWFPMRITYHREMKIKALLDEFGIENFLPMHWEVIETKTGGRKRMLLPAIHNLIFVRRVFSDALHNETAIDERRKKRDYACSGPADAKLYAGGLCSRR